MNYTFNQLRIYLKVVQTESVTKASEELHLTQPAVSIQLKAFQSQFSIPLTETIGRQIFITQFGREIAAAAEKILEAVNAIDAQTLAHKGELHGTLKIAIVSTGKYIMPHFLSGFLSQHKGVNLQLEVTNKAQVLQSLEENTVDFALMSVLPKNGNLNTVELLQNQLYLVGNQDQPFRKKPYDKTLFKTLPLIYREAGSGTRHVMEAFILANKLPVVKRMELTSNEAVKQAVVAGMGYSIMPLIGLKNELANGELQIIPVAGFPLKSVWHLAWRKGKGFSRVAGAYLEYVEAEKKNIVVQKFDWLKMYGGK